jgi:hypothetical protein
LLRQDFINKGLQPPTPALTKAAFAANCALHDWRRRETILLPSHAQGMGETNLGTLFDATPRYVRDQKAADKFTASGQVRTFNVAVADPAKPLRVVVAWTDAPGSTTGNAYNNNLDLTVTAGGNTYVGNVFAGANSTTGGVADVRNNTESVFLPPGISGPVVITVTAANINSNGVPNDADTLDQDFALFAYNTSGPSAPDVVAGRATLTAESFSPANNLPDSAESVTFNFELKNLAAAGSGNIVATLATAGNVINPSAPQSYGAISGGGSATRAFTFTVSGSATAATGHHGPARPHIGWRSDRVDHVRDPRRAPRRGRAGSDVQSRQ